MPPDPPPSGLRARFTDGLGEGLEAGLGSGFDAGRATGAGTEYPRDTIDGPGLAAGLGAGLVAGLDVGFEAGLAAGRFTGFGTENPRDTTDDEGRETGFDEEGLEEDGRETCGAEFRCEDEPPLRFGELLRLYEGALAMGRGATEGRGVVTRGVPAPMRPPIEDGEDDRFEFWFPPPERFCWPCPPRPAASSGMGPAGTKRRAAIQMAPRGGFGFMVARSGEKR